MQRAGPFAEIDEETARDMLAEVNKLALGPVAESFTDGDRNPPVFDPATGTVTLPESFKRSYRTLTDADVQRSVDMILTALGREHGAVQR